LCSSQPRSMTRLWSLTVLVASACTPRNSTAGLSATTGNSLVSAAPNVDAARELDQNGVRSFADGRYADALAYFRAARKLGGPSSELWNAARCLERMDDLEGADRMLEEYLAQRDLLPKDRAEAQRDVLAIRSRVSSLTVATNPPGASVVVDGQQAPTPTPTSAELRPGVHTIVMRRAGYAARTVEVVARFGRPVIIALDLAGPQK
jgi:hypothetical protein